MEAISIVHLQHLSEQFLGTGRALYLKIAYLLVTLVFILFVLLLDGKVARIYEDAQNHDLHIPAGKYYLADAGYPLSPELLTPYRNIHYYLTEWGGHAGTR